MNVGRNVPCPCGSNLKFKKCCGINNSKNFELSSNGIIVKHYDSNQTFNIGSPGMSIQGLVFDLFGKNENKESVKKNMDNLDFVLDVDLPFLLPIDADRYDINVLGESFIVHHIIKKRGQESFSTIETARLPYFSALQLQGKAFDDDNYGLHKEPENEENAYPKSYSIIIAILSKLERFLKNHNEDFEIKEKYPVLSYTIRLYYRGLPHTKENSAMRSMYPYSGRIKIESPDEKKEIDNEKLKGYLSQVVQLQSFIENKIKNDVAKKDFVNKILLCVHDYIYYARQHSKAISLLKEEQIRDLFLIILKNIFGQAEGEVFSFDGKLDFKVVNPDNKYEYITGEFKWWSGESSFKEVFHQAVRKHFTGQEKEVYIIILSNNKDVNNVTTKITNLVKSELEVIGNTEILNISPKGSKEFISEYGISVRGVQTILKVCVADLYYENK